MCYCPDLFLSVTLISGKYSVVPIQLNFHHSVFMQIVVEIGHVSIAFLLDNVGIFSTLNLSVGLHFRHLDLDGYVDLGYGLA